MIKVNLKFNHAIFIGFMLVLKCEFALSTVVFKIEKIRGKVSIFYPGDLSPKELKTSSHFIYSGGLVEVFPEGYLELSQHKLLGSNPIRLGKKIAKIRLNLPSVLRLNSDTLRTYRTKPYPIKTLLSATKKESKPVRKKPVLDLMNAFQRSMVELTNPDYIPKLLPDPEIKPVDTAIKVEELKILMPVNDSLFYLQKGEAKVPILWEKNVENAPFSIYLWKEGEAKGTPYAASEANSYLVRIKDSGSYYLQIVSEDRKYRSKKIRITVDPQRFASGSWNYPKDFLERRDRPSRIILEKPINKIKIYSDIPNYLMSFAWEDLDNSPPYRIQILRDGEVVVNETLQDSQFTTPLKSGDYSWIVSYSRDAVGSRLEFISKSKPGYLSINSAKTSKRESFEKLLTELFNSSEDATYYWDF